MNRIKELDGLRAIAVGLVMMAHTAGAHPGSFPRWMTPFFDGPLGVLIFFVLSGYLITGILLREHDKNGTISLGSFYIKRALRILPASYFYLSTVAVLSFLGVISVSYLQLIVCFAHLWNYSASLLPPGQPDQAFHIVGHFWSLAIEEQFYWVWPLAIILFKRHLTWLLVAVIVFSPVLRIAQYVLTPDLRPQLTMMFHTGADPLAVGALLAAHRDRAAAILSKWGTPILNGIVVCLFGVIPILRHFLEGKWTISPGRTIESAMAAALITILLYRKDFWLSRLLRMSAFQYVGAISFSLYLWQQAFCFPGSILTLTPLLAIGTSLFAASVSYYLIEQPFQRLRPWVLSRYRSMRHHEHGFEPA